MQRITAIITRDLDGIVIGWSPGAETLLGYAGSEMIGRALDHLLPPLGAAQEGAETTVATKSGALLPVLCVRTPVVDGAGALVGSITVLTPRTAPLRHAPELAMMSAEVPSLCPSDLNLLERLVATAPGAFCSFRLWRDGRGACPFASPKIEELLGFTAAQLLQDVAPVLARVHPDDRSRVLATLEESARTLSPWRCEYRFDHPTLGEVWLECHSVPSRDSDDSTHWLGFVRDISERKRAEEALRVSQAQLVSALEAGGMGVWIWDVARDEVWMDDALLQLVGRRRDELAPSSEAVLALAHPDDRERVREALHHLAETPRELQFEHRIIDAGGGVKFLSVRGRSEADLSQRVARATALNIDITTQKEASDARLRSQKLEALGTLASGIAHDFNNILQAIGGNTALAQRALPADHGARRFLDEVAAASARASELVRRILTFSRPGEQQVEVMALQPVITDALKLVRASLPAQIEIRPTLSPQTLNVRADATQIHQIVINLATNAAHAIGAAGGLIEMELSRAPDLLPDPSAPAGTGAYALLTVRDNGSGMPPETLGKIFDPFFTTKPVGQGTGLGLSVVHGLVKSLGGAVSVESQLGRGTTFRLYFPLVEERVEEDQTPEAADAATGKVVLFVDDEEVLVILGKHILETLGYTAIGHQRPREALEAFIADPSRIDAVVTDVSMPGISGFELAKRLRELRTDIPIVMMSGYVGPDETEAAARIGVRDLLLKPVSIDQLERALARALGGTVGKAAERRRLK